MTQDVTNPVQIEAGRAERDGCGCPEWTLRCAHFDRRWIMLRDEKRVVEALSAHHDLEGCRYLVLCDLQVAVCSCGVAHGVHPWGGLFESDDLTAAEAAFDRYEEALIRGEMEPS